VNFEKSKLKLVLFFHLAAKASGEHFKTFFKKIPIDKVKFYDINSATNLT